MVSKVQPGAEARARMSVYDRMAAVGFIRDSYAGKFALAAFVGIMVPLAIFTGWLLVSRTSVAEMYPVLAALFLACFAGFLGTLWMLRELLMPVELTAEALRTYIETRRLPDLPLDFPDRAGRLMEGTQYTLTQLHETISRLERISDAEDLTGVYNARAGEKRLAEECARAERDLPLDFPDRAGRLMEGTQYTLTQLHETISRLERISDAEDLTGVYNARAGEKRLAEECARAERDLQTFQIALFDINDFGGINTRHGHSAGDACISHVAALLQLNTRRGDWVARWGADEFVVGLHRNRALKMVMERIVKAVGASPCEISPGLELRVGVSCGVAEYRFGSGVQGVIADAEKALLAAKLLARNDAKSHVCYRNELSDAAPRPAVAA